MENLTGIAHLLRLLTDAVDQLSDVKHKLSLFEKQRFYRLKKEMEDHQNLSAAIRSGLAQISTSEINFLKSQ